VLASIPGRDFQVAGHTDNDPIATEKFPSNWDLGAARSITVTRLLVDSGLPADRVSASSYADTVPVVANDTAEGKAANRRIEIVVVPDLSLMPGYDELQRLASGK
jgi:chemotaxis protein MotB